MPKGIQKSVPKLAVVGLLALLMFNFPILSLYRGDVMSVPVSYIGLFGAWLLVILLAAWAVGSGMRKPFSQRRMERDSA